MGKDKRYLKLELMITSNEYENSHFVCLNHEYLNHNDKYLSDNKGSIESYGYISEYDIITNNYNVIYDLLNKSIVHDSGGYRAFLIYKDKLRIKKIQNLICMYG